MFVQRQRSCDTAAECLVEDKVQRMDSVQFVAGYFSVADFAEVFCYACFCYFFFQHFIIVLIIWDHRNIGDLAFVTRSCMCNFF